MAATHGAAGRARSAFAPLQRALDELRAQPGIERLAARLTRERAPLLAELGEAVQALVPAFAASRNVDVLPQLAEHLPKHVDEIVRLLFDGAVGNFEFVCVHARLRAGQYFPLDAELHAYRCAHKIIARRLLSLAEASAPTVIARLADFALEYTDAISTLMSTEFVEQARQLASVAVDEQAALLALLLSGYDESDRRAGDHLRRAGFFDGRQSFCVVLAQSVDPAHMNDAARARRMADALDDLLPFSVARRLVGVRSGCVTMVLAALRRVSGWTAPLPTLSSRAAVKLALAGNDVFIGISQDVEATARIPAAYRQAGFALQLAHMGERVRRFDDLAMRDLLLHEAMPALRDLLPPWQVPLADADRKIGGAMIATLQAMSDVDLNVTKAAVRLGVHPNTLYARFERIRTITGLDPRSYHGLETLLLVSDAARMQHVR